MNLDGMLTVPKMSLESHITALSDDKMAAVAQAIKFALGLD